MVTSIRPSSFPATRCAATLALLLIGFFGCKDPGSTSDSRGVSTNQSSSGELSYSDEDRDTCGDLVDYFSGRLVREDWENVTLCLSKYSGLNQESAQAEFDKLFAKHGKPKRFNDYSLISMGNGNVDSDQIFDASVPKEARFAKFNIELFTDFDPDDPSFARGGYDLIVGLTKEGEGFRIASWEVQPFED